MFLKRDGLKKTESKCDLMEEKRDSIEVESLDLVMPRKPRRKWHILNVVLLVTILALAAWTMIYKQYRFSALSPSKIEDEIFKTTMKVVSETEVVLKEIRQQAEIMCQKNRESALQYVTEIRDAMKDRTKLGVKKVNQVVEENLSSIRVELLALETTTKDIFNGLVDILQSDIDKVVEKLSTVEEQNLTYALNDAISQAEYEVHAMWNDIDQMYSYYTSYSTDLIWKKAENITERINGLVASQIRNCDCTLYERVSMCYNISSANIEISRNIETLVHTISQLYNTTDAMDKLQSVNTDADEHALTVINDSNSLMDKYKQTTQELLETLLTDHFCFLGSAVRVTAENTYPHIKRFILRSWRSAIENARTELNETLTVDPLIKEEYRQRIINDPQETLQKLGDLIKAKAALLKNETLKNKIIEQADFSDLSLLMESRFKNVTEVINEQYEIDLWNTAETMKYNVEFIIDQKVPFLSSITIQNYLPTDVCPLAMDFSNFVFRFLDTDLYKSTGNDVLDRLLPEHGDIAYVSEGTQNDDVDNSEQETDIHIRIMLLGDGSSENDEGLANTALESIDNVNDGNRQVEEPKPFLLSKPSPTNDNNRPDSVVTNEPALNYDVEPKPDGYVEPTEDTSTDLERTEPVGDIRENSDQTIKFDTASVKPKPSYIAQRKSSKDEKSVEDGTSGKPDTILGLHETRAESYSADLESPMNEKPRTEIKPSEEAKSDEKGTRDQPNKIPRLDGAPAVTMKPVENYTADLVPPMNVKLGSDISEVQKASPPQSISGKPDSSIQISSAGETLAAVEKSSDNNTNGPDVAIYGRPASYSKKSVSSFEENKLEHSISSDEREVEVDSAALTHKSAEKSKDSVVDVVEADQKEIATAQVPAENNSDANKLALTSTEKLTKKKNNAIQSEKAAITDFEQDDISSHTSSADEKEVDFAADSAESVKNGRQRFVNAVKKVEKMNEGVEAIGARKDSK